MLLLFGVLFRKIRSICLVQLLELVLQVVVLRNFLDLLLLLLILPYLLNADGCENLHHKAKPFPCLMPIKVWISTFPGFFYLPLHYFVLKRFNRIQRVLTANSVVRNLNADILEMDLIVFVDRDVEVSEVLQDILLLQIHFFLIVDN